MGAWRLEGSDVLHSLHSLRSLQALDLSQTATHVGTALLANLQRAPGLTRLALARLHRCFSRVSAL